MGNEVGIEDSDGATVGSIVGMDVDSSSSLVPEEEVGKPNVDTDPVLAGSTAVTSDAVVAGAELEGVSV